MFPLPFPGWGLVMYVGASSMVSTFPRVSPVWRFPDKQWSPGGIAKYESAGGDILGSGRDDKFRYSENGGGEFTWLEFKDGEKEGYCTVKMWLVLLFRHSHSGLRTLCPLWFASIIRLSEPGICRPDDLESISWVSNKMPRKLEVWTYVFWGVSFYTFT